MKKIRETRVYEQDYGNNGKMIQYGERRSVTVWNRENGFGSKEMMVEVNWTAFGCVTIEEAEQFLYELTTAIKKAKQWEKENKRNKRA